ncbi:MAG: peptide-methionine (R)-S-oxide reductase MsrB [Alphaproteobacteria bacterium]|nr:peptide-methionine (R)-S-oxide reductase MsrB [Alphaproteobacteria bacterium]
MIRRRYLLSSGAAVLAGGAALALFQRAAGGAQPAATFEVAKSEQEWRTSLSPLQFAILRKHATEPPFSSPLDYEKRAGMYNCAGCELPVFSSADKFDSGTGWPSFTRPVEGAVATSEDRSLLMLRTEVHCRRCGGHLGHVFEDGPPPTHQRWCINGGALNFRPT